MQVSPVRFEHHREPFGIGEASPRLSWITTTDQPNWVQLGYQLELRDADGAVTSTGIVESRESLLVDWPFAPLVSRQRVSVRVRVWHTTRNDQSAISEWSDAETGLLNSDDWSAQMISPAVDDDRESVPPVHLFRSEFEAAAPIRKARLYVTAHGVYDLEINGIPVGDQVLAPGWTSYNHRIRYQTFDVTNQLQQGTNAIGAWVGEGWFRGRMTWGAGRRNIWGSQAGLLAQLEVEYADGSTQIVSTDESWKSSTGGTISSEIYDGETHDARLEPVGWTKPGFDDSAWTLVKTSEFDVSRLIAPMGPPVRRKQTLPVSQVITSPSGKTILDFGQNLVGRLRFEVEGEAGTTITICHAEVLEHGELGVRPLRKAKATNHYTLRGGAPETWEPRFTFHGFRYAEVSGWPGTLDPTAIEAIVLHSDLASTGSFDCSSELINQMHRNAVWSMRGNFLDVPTDCPQRDERLGWTGDIQVFAPAASFLYDCSGMLASWLKDLAAEQFENADGIPPLVSPDVVSVGRMAATAWGDATAVVPTVLYERFGDLKILRDQYLSMKTWVDLVAKRAGDRYIWDSQWQFGDWLDPAAPPEDAAATRTDMGLVATAYLAHSSRLVSKVAAILGNESDAEKYETLSQNVRAAFAHEYITATGRVASESQTAYGLAIRFDLFANDEQRTRGFERLAHLVHANHYRIGTGFVGTPLICDALEDAGQTQLAYRMLLETSCPSFLYPVTMGATTIWERWDSMIPNGDINPCDMTSFNHYALGAVVDFLHRRVAGLAPAEPGYRKLAIKPRPGGDLTHASASLETPYGLASSGWTIEGGKFTLNLQIPANTSALIELPDGSAPFTVGSGGWTYSTEIQPQPYPPIPPASLVFPMETPTQDHV
ncbi:glycoside hydrolase family 78 protein [soil metagenome]